MSFMDNQPIPQQPVPQPQVPQPTPAQPAPGAAKPAAPLPKDQTKSNRKFVLGCLGAFGCSIFLFLGVLFAFLAFGSNESPIFSFLGVPPSEVTNVLITLVNLLFLVIVFVAFVFVVIGIFKIATARKDDKPAKRSGAVFTGLSFAVLIMLVFTWIFAYFYLDSKRTEAPRIAILTEPAKTTNLTAPVSISFDASAAPIPRDHTVLSYEWDFGDGTKLSGPKQSHTYTSLGNFQSKLTLKLRNRVNSEEVDREFLKDVTVSNVIANVIIKASKKAGPAPLEVELDGSESNSPNGEITGYAWDLDADGEFDDGAEEKTSATFDKIGKYKVGLRVTDSTGAFAIGELELEVTPPDTPVAVITVEDVEGTTLESGKSYVFSGAASTSPNGAIEKYEWKFGDGEEASTRTATHAFKTAGEYEVTLTVTDSAKKKNEAAKRFTVAAPDSPPIAVIKTTPEAADNVLEGETPFEVVFDASGSQDANNNIVEYAWDFDGNNKTDDTNPTTSHKYLDAGTFNASLTVTDATELKHKTQIVVKVTAAGLKADLKADPIAGTTPLTVKFDASGSNYAEGTITAFEWEFGDSGSPRTDISKVSHQYSSIGMFTAKVTAVASDGKRASKELQITVRPVSIKSCFEPNVDNGTAPLEVEFDPSCATGAVTKYRWDFAGLGTSSDRRPKFTFENPGDYPVTLEVSDNANVVDRFSLTIKVEAP